jgi:hypothetical protein
VERYERIGFRRNLIYSGLRLMKIGQTWNCISTVFILPSVEISLINAVGGIVELVRFWLRGTLRAS